MNQSLQQKKDSFSTTKGFAKRFWLTQSVQQNWSNQRERNKRQETSIIMMRDKISQQQHKIRLINGILTIEVPLLMLRCRRCVRYCCHYRWRWQVLLLRFWPIFVVSSRDGTVCGNKVKSPVFLHEFLTIFSRCLMAVSLWDEKMCWWLWDVRQQNWLHHWIFPIFLHSILEKLAYTIINWLAQTSAPSRNVMHFTSTFFNMLYDILYNVATIRIKKDEKYHIIRSLFIMRL